jgi:3-carboxymethyl-3-hydroxy-acyl-[acp] dehydratase
MPGHTEVTVPWTITGDGIAELHAAVDTAERDPGSRALVLTGTGGRFCSGMDLTDAAEDAHAEHGSGAFYDLLTRFATCRVAVVSIVDGAAHGGGVGLVAASDLVIAGARARFSLPEALWGLLPCAVLPFLIRRTGFQPAYAMALRTQPITATQALGYRLVDEVAEDPVAAQRVLLARLARLPAAAVPDLKRYAAELSPVPTGAKMAAVREFTRLSASPPVRHALSRYASDGLFPWEQ